MKTTKAIIIIVIMTIIAHISDTSVINVSGQESSRTNFTSLLPVVLKPLPIPQLIQSRPVWKVLLLIYRNTDVDYVDKNGSPKHLSLSLTEQEFQDGLWGLREYASIANDFSNGEALLTYDSIIIDHPINSITRLGSDGYWLSPDDIQSDLDLYAPAGKYDSVLVYWPAHNFSTGEGIPSYGWGYGMAAGGRSNNATYAVVWNAPSYWWGLPPMTGQVWLHEWLHGVCPFYADENFTMPSQDADGGGSHGYQSSPTTGWASYYRDLMTGKVLEDGVYTGIVPDAWRSGSLRGNHPGAFVDYFYTNTLSSYITTGIISWDSKYQNILIGGIIENDNTLYKSITFDQKTTISGRAYIPSDGVGPFDSVAIALKDEKVEYWATIAYGNSLYEKNNISIIRNGEWGNLFQVDLSPGWYTIKVSINYSDSTINMKAWKDGQNEPGWQLTEPIDPSWRTKLIGFRHYGKGSIVDDLIVMGTQ